jgi:hypothetical protein
MFEKQQKNKIEKKVHAVFYQVGFILEVICKWRYNDNDIITTNKLPGMYFFFY